MKRIGAFAFAVVAYAAFLGSFTYLVGFTSGLLVPKSVAHGGNASLGPAAATPWVPERNPARFNRLLLEHVEEKRQRVETT